MPFFTKEGSTIGKPLWSHLEAELTHNLSFISCVEVEKNGVGREQGDLRLFSKRLVWPLIDGE